MTDVKKMYINGEWVAAESGNTLDVTSPATGEVVGTIAFGGQKEAQMAIDAADEAFASWSALTARERAKYLSKLSGLLAKNRDELAGIIAAELGKPIRESVGEVLGAVDNFTWYAEEAKRVYGETVPSTFANKRLHVMKQPVGVVGAITPWNFPINMAARKIAPALAAGCTVVLKPAEITPLTAVKLFELIEQAGFPKGVVNLVLGDAPQIGEEFTSNKKVSKITFTGSTRVGKLLMRQAADQMKRVSFELGGHAPFIVFADADIDKAVKGLFDSKYRNTGQMCICTNRLFVHESIADEFAEKLAKRIERSGVGDGRDANVEIGPLVNQAALDKVLDHIEDAKGKGAEVLVGGSQLTEGDYAKGFFCEPTVLKGVTSEMKIVTEETFGPVVPIITFNDDEEVIKAANDSDYGLAAYMFSNDINKCLTVPERLEYGIVGVNDGSPAQTQAPFGGFKESGLGREGGKWGIEGFLETKFVSYGI